MTKKQFWIGIACLYGIGLAVALSIANSQQPVPTNAVGLVGLIAVPLVWGIGPIGLTFVWLALKRWDLAAAKFGLLVFAALSRDRIYSMVVAGPTLAASTLAMRERHDLPYLCPIGCRGRSDSVSGLYGRADAARHRRSGGSYSHRSTQGDINTANRVSTRGR
jgi:hypothetical protein